MVASNTEKPIFIALESDNLVAQAIRISLKDKYDVRIFNDGAEAMNQAVELRGSGKKVVFYTEVNAPEGKLEDAVFGKPDRSRLNGVPLVSELRDRAETATMPVIVASGAHWITQEQLRDVGLNRNVVLGKGFGPRELNEAIDKAIGLMEPAKSHARINTPVKDGPPVVTMNL
jgi:DNA-binding response OmpR family regulator